MSALNLRGFLGAVCKTVKVRGSTPPLISILKVTMIKRILFAPVVALIATVVCAILIVLATIVVALLCVAPIIITIIYLLAGLETYKKYQDKKEKSFAASVWAWR